METTVFAKSFQSPEYLKFKEFISKSSTDGTVHISNNKVVYGSKSTPIPSFKDTELVKTILEDKKQTLLLEYSDIYDKIVIADEPLMFKKKYQAIVDAITEINLQLDELSAYVSAVHDQTVQLPRTRIEEKISQNDVRVQTLMNGMNDNVHLSKKKIQELVVIHKDNMSLQQQLTEAKNATDMSYVIWGDNSNKNGNVNVTNSPSINRPKPVVQSRNVRLTDAKKTAIKKSAKHLMVEKLS